ncbi:MAG: outer membrane beta-barrel domain-containing protein [Deltaproteobacteria bacterium]|nr:outer membrane beta-barrel domain-containing protein [Deltaproteobacteria bacterium]MBW2256707.1 outer membrane beta-barrel domain-containing protein [Deltaproteobacteria bacterium]
MPFSRIVRSAAALGVLGLLGGAAMPAHAESPGIDALDEFRSGDRSRSAIENRFFLKGDRFELAPMFGYVPNNPFAKRFVGGLLLAYHFNEHFAAEGLIAYSPDLGEDDLKGLTKLLVVIAHTGPGGSDFQQPLDKIKLWATFGAAWTPIYGKINLIGETVLNFDLSFTGSLGVISKVNYFARFDNSGQGSSVVLEKAGNEVKLSPSLGVGTNFFINQTIALKLDGRFTFYVDNKPQYCEGTGCDPVTQQRLYNNFTVSGGLAFFFPRMKPRLYDF